MLPVVSANVVENKPFISDRGYDIPRPIIPKGQKPTFNLAVELHEESKIDPDIFDPYCGTDKPRGRNCYGMAIAYLIKDVCEWHNITCQSKSIHMNPGVLSGAERHTAPFCTTNSKDENQALRKNLKEMYKHPNIGQFVEDDIRKLLKLMRDRKIIPESFEGLIETTQISCEEVEGLFLENKQNRLEPIISSIITFYAHEIGSEKGNYHSISVSKGDALLRDTKGNFYSYFGKSKEASQSCFLTTIRPPSSQPSVLSVDKFGDDQEAQTQM